MNDLESSMRIGILGVIGMNQPYRGPIPCIERLATAGFAGATPAFLDPCFGSRDSLTNGAPGKFAIVDFKSGVSVHANNWPK